MKIPDSVKLCIGYLGIRPYDSSGTQATKTKYLGTGFLAGVQDKNTGAKFLHLITAKHVAEKLSEANEFFLRLNTRDGKSEELSAGRDNFKWYFHETDDSADVAVTPLGINADHFVFSAIPSEMFVIPSDIPTIGIGAGDQVFMTGLFSCHVGQEKNLPIIRTGNIALMSEEKIFTAKYGYMDAYLIESRSLGGLSGSPVFVIKEKFFPQGNTVITAQIWFLGLVHGHWNIDKQTILTTTEEDAAKDAINTGIAIVTPAFKIAEIMFGKTLTKEREDWMSKNMIINSPTPGVP